MTKREVARETPTLWARADAGASVYILDKGRPAYRVEAITGPVDPLDDLMRRGLLSPATGSTEPFVPASVPAEAARRMIDDFEAGRNADDEW
jgi:antitoxin (DNA-binding transcriptional repressor) of toxin-antitoxin stability system